MSDEPICPICASKAHPDIRAWRLLALDHSPKDYLILRCTECGLRWLNPYASPDEYQSLYGEGYYEGELGNLSYRAEKLELALCYENNAQHFHALGVREGLLDIGCGTGDFLCSAARVGISGQGIEPSHYAVQEAKNKGLIVSQGTLSDLVSTGATYSAAHCSHVLEHVPDAHEFLNQLNSLLEPGAPVYIEVPIQFDGILDTINRLRGRQFVFSEHSIHHHYFFTPYSLSRLLYAHGFIISSLTTFLPCRRSLRKSDWKKWLLQALLWISDKSFHRGDVISIWAQRKK